MKFKQFTKFKSNQFFFILRSRLLIFFILFSINLFSQNLIFNGGFEDGPINSPITHSQVDLLDNWIDALQINIEGAALHSPDWCKTGDGFFNVITNGTPEIPYLGESFIGMAKCELIQQDLSQNLNPGNSYYLTFMVKTLDHAVGTNGAGCCGSYDWGWELSTGTTTPAEFQVLSSPSSINYIPNPGTFHPDYCNFVESSTLLTSTQINYSSLNYWRRIEMNFQVPMNGLTHDWIIFQLTNAEDDPDHSYILIDEMDLYDCSNLPDPFQERIFCAYEETCLQLGTFVSQITSVASSSNLHVTMNPSSCRGDLSVIAITSDISTGLIRVCYDTDCGTNECRTISVNLNGIANGIFEDDYFRACEEFAIIESIPSGVTIQSIECVSNPGCENFHYLDIDIDIENAIIEGFPYIEGEYAFHYYYTIPCSEEVFVDGFALHIDGCEGGEKLVKNTKMGIQQKVLKKKKNPEKRKSIDIIPNPADDNILVSYNLANDRVNELNIYNINGQMVRNINYQCDVKDGQFMQNINLSNLATGTYVIALHTEKGVEIRRFIKS